MNSDLSPFKIIYFEHHYEITRFKHEKLVEKLESEGFKIIGKNNFKKDIDTICMKNTLK